MITVKFGSRIEKATMQKNGYLLFEDGTELNQYELQALNGVIVDVDSEWEIGVVNNKETYGNREARNVNNKFSIKFRGNKNETTAVWTLNTNTIKDLRKIIDKSFKVYTV